MAIRLRVLLLEDSEDDAELLLRQLRRGGYDPVYTQVQTAEAMTAALAERAWDIILSDYSMPGFSAPVALALLQKSGIDLPFIIISGTVGEDLAIAAMKSGAHDFIMKSQLRRLIPSIELRMREAAARREHQQSQKNLRLSEERFRQLAESITEVFWMTDPAKNEILYISPGYEKIWGRTCEDLYANPAGWMEAIHPDDRESVMGAARAKQVLGSYDEEYRVIQPDGTLRWVRDRAFPIKDETGRVYRVTGIAQDITDRKLAEDQLRNAKEFSETLIQTANVIILGLDTDGNIDIFNETAKKITGYTLAELKHKNWFEILTPKERYPRVWEEFSRLTTGGIPQVFENPILTKTGEERHIMWQNNQVRANNQIIATISFGNDITERKQAEEELQRRHEELMATNRRLEEVNNQLLQAEKMAAIGQMAAGVAHEINNPVGYVRSNLDTLQNYVSQLLRIVDAYTETEGMLNAHRSLFEPIHRLKESVELDYLKDDVVELLKESKEGVSRVQQIVRDLKSFSHVDEEDWLWSDLHNGLNSTLNVAHHELKYKAQVIKEYGDIPQIQCRLSQLNQVFMNLLMNAAHAINDRGTIWIRTGADADWVWVEIEDSGKGIAPEHLSRIFEPFFTTKPVGKGTGLGLSLSYGIVAKHRGRIEVDSQPGKGARFRIWLPQRHHDPEQEITPI